MKDEVAIIGVGCTKVGDLLESSYEDTVLEAPNAAFADAGIEAERIDAAWFGSFSPYGGHGKAAVSLADALGLYGKPITRVENFCATGTDAFCNAVASGMYDIALVSGGLKSFGHTFSAGGVRMIYVAITPLCCQAAARQIKDAGLGLVHNLGGPVSVACVLVPGTA
jgi:acetyl-CoA acetyltransferase